MAVSCCCDDKMVVHGDSLQVVDNGNIRHKKY